MGPVQTRGRALRSYTQGTHRLVRAAVGMIREQGFGAVALTS
jgi:hypothetical protein